MELLQVEELRAGKLEYADDNLYSGLDTLSSQHHAQVNFVIFFPLGLLAARPLSLSADSLFSCEDNSYLLHTSFLLHLITLLLSPTIPFKFLLVPICGTYV